MIVVYAGRRPSSEDGVFPPSREEYLAERVERLLTGLSPTRLVGSAAAGSDVIILEAAARLGIPATVVLAGDIESFAADSVEDKRGWRSRFDAVLSAPGVTVESLALTESGGDAYRAVTRQFIERAERLRHEAAAEEDAPALVGLLLSGGSRGANDYTEDLGLQLEAAGHLVLRLNPKRGRDSAPVAFVAMPFGERRDPSRGLRRYDADATWNRLLLPALLDAGYRAVRTDAEASRQLIDSRMVLDLLGADLVVADLATLNPNVFWELGVRHTARRQGTLVVAPARLSPPFDVRAVPVHPYERDPGGVTDTQAVDGVRGLRAAIRSASTRQRYPQVPDSPVHAAVPELRLSGVPTGASYGTAWMERITVAAELRNADELLTLVAKLDRGDLSHASKRALRVEAGLALVRLRQHAEAIDVLRPVVDEDPEYDNEQLQQQFAHALVRARGDEAGREARLLLAEHRLRVLDERHADSGETLGLLGSAAKERARLRHIRGHDATGELRLAAEAYRQGFVADPLDHYPGVNAVALFRLLGHHGQGRQREEDLAAARGLLPVVRFAVSRLGVPADDVWAQATLGELALQAHFLTGDGNGDELETARRHYALAASHSTPQQLGSMAGQLEMMLTWGDPAELVEPLLYVVRSRM
jgi:tetratricopeptide (TPR) repeat protein